MEAALSEADATCSPPVGHTYHCEILRYQIIRSMNLIFPKYGKSDWTMSVSYDRRGSDIRNVHVTFTEKYELLDYLGRVMDAPTPYPAPRTAPLPAGW